MTAFNRSGIKLHVRLGLLNCKFPVGAFPFFNFLLGHHNQSLILGRANLRAVAAARAIQGAELHAEGISGELLARGRFGYKISRRVVFNEHGPYAGMGAYQSALIALYAVFRNPFGKINGNAALLILSCTRGHIPGRIKRGNRQAITLLSQDGMHYSIKILGSGNMEFIRSLFSIRPAFGIINLLNAAYSIINSGIVHINYSVALLAVGFLNGLLHIIFRFVVRYNLGELEERSHHNHIDSSAQTYL